VRRLFVLALVLAAVTVAVVGFQRFSQERQYRRLLAAGEEALRVGESYAAIEAFSGALALRPSSMVAYFRRGEAYGNERQDANAIRDLREAGRLAPDAPEPLVALGELYDLRGDPARAADWYGQAALRLRDADPQLLYWLAMAHYRAGAPAAAKAPLERALARDPSVAEAHYLLGLVSRDIGADSDAESSLEQAIRLAPGLVGAREELADLYRASGRIDEERGQLEALAALDDRVGRQIALALADLRRSRFDAALARLTAAADNDPTNSRLQLAIARTHLARAEQTDTTAPVASALAALDRALGGSARRSEGLALYGRALYLSGDLVTAERLLRDATATSPVDPEAFSFLADAAERLSHPTIARDALIDLAALEGDTVAASTRAARAQRIGSLSLAAGDPATAATFLSRADHAGLRTARALGLLARAKWQLGDHDAARRALAEALALDSLDADLRRLSRTFN
jgi:tetratricopeptide (TPR) repeat protein